MSESGHPLPGAPHHLRGLRRGKLPPQRHPLLVKCFIWVKAQSLPFRDEEAGFGEIISSPSKEIKPVNPKEINPEYLLEGLMLKLKLQYFGHLRRRTDSLEKTLILEKIKGRRRRGTTEDEMIEWHHQLCGHEFEQSLGAHGVPKSQTQLSN